jgi:excisionase family DNA binding protein
MRQKKEVESTHKNADSKSLFLENSIWMTVKDTARYLSRTENAIRILMCRKILRVYRMGRRVYLKRSEIDLLIESSTLNGGY